MALGNELLTLRNFINSAITQNSTRNITGAQLNSAFTQMMNIIAGVITLASITHTHHDVVSGDISGGKTSFIMTELIDAEIFMVSSQTSIYFPITDLSTIVAGDVNLYYVFNPSTGQITTLDFGPGFSIIIYYRPAS